MINAKRWTTPLDQTGVEDDMASKCCLLESVIGETTIDERWLFHRESSIHLGTCQQFDNVNNDNASLFRGWLTPLSSPPFLLPPFPLLFLLPPPSSLLPPPSYQIRIFNEPVSKYSTSNRPVLPPFLSTSRKKKKPVPLLLDVIDIYFFFSWILLIIIKWACISLIRNRLVTELLPKINPAIIFRVARLFLSKPVLKLMELLI